MNRLRITRVRAGDACQRRVESGGFMHVALPEDGVLLEADGKAVYVSKSNMKLVQRVLRGGDFGVAPLFGDEEHESKR